MFVPCKHKRSQRSAFHLDELSIYYNRILDSGFLQAMYTPHST